MFDLAEWVKEMVANFGEKSLNLSPNAQSPGQSFFPKFNGGAPDPEVRIRRHFAPRDGDPRDPRCMFLGLVSAPIEFHHA
jgi:hypothetical protein